MAISSCALALSLRGLAWIAHSAKLRIEFAIADAAIKVRRVTRETISYKSLDTANRCFFYEHKCPFLAVRPEGANHQWRKIPPRELSIDLEADERLEGNWLGWSLVTNVAVGG